MTKTDFPKLRDAMTPDEIAAIKPHPGWSDGREGYMWCRFDAVVDRKRWLRAEITWGDDLEFKDNENGEVRIYFAPELFIETNRPQGPRGQSWVTYDGETINLTKDEAVTLASSDPREILTKYADVISKLKFWEDGHVHAE